MFKRCNAPLEEKKKLKRVSADRIVKSRCVREKKTKESGEFKLAYLPNKKKDRMKRTNTVRLMNKNLMANLIRIAY